MFKDKKGKPKLRVGRTEDNISVIVAQEYYVKKAKAVTVSAFIAVIIFFAVVVGATYFLMSEYDKYKRLEEEYFILSTTEILLNAYSNRVSTLIEADMGFNEKKVFVDKFFTDLLRDINATISAMKKVNTVDLNEYIIPPLVTLKNDVEKSRESIKNATSIGDINAELMKVNDKIVYLKTIIKNMKEEKSRLIAGITDNWVYTVFKLIES